ncbi:MAG: SDR family oxidoreductase [Ilumatobacteraceae bacterium]
MFDYTDRVVLITGGGQNVGAEVATTLAAQGATVAVNDLTADRAAGVVDKIIAAGGKAVVAAADVTDADAVNAAVADVVAAVGPIDVLVNNAGIPAGGMGLVPFLRTSPADWKPFIDLNLYGVLNCTSAVLGGMVDRGWGRVVTIVSDAGRLGERGQAAYAASKAGAAAFMRSIAKEVGRNGVTCNSVSLGSIEREGTGRDPEILAKQLKFYPMNRLGRPADIAALVTWLASSEASWVTGQTIPLNGGYGTS